MTVRSYSDDQLKAAVEQAHSWRGVLRSLGLSATSAGSQRSVRRHADRLGLDYAHFTGQRRWTDSQLARAVANALCWAEVVSELGLANHGNNVTAVRTHASRIGADTSHFTDRRDRSGSDGVVRFGPPQAAHLRNAGPNLAAAWFLLCGMPVLWPLEPCRYDFVVQAHDTFHRIQVKTTTYGDGLTSFATMSTSSRNGRALYTEDQIDYFFVIDADFDAYLIPVAAVLGLHSISLRAYCSFRVAEGGQWLRPGDRHDADRPVSGSASRGP